MALQLYDLAGADPAHRFSPYCWRTRLALAHKGLEAELIPWRFAQKEVLAAFGQERVPVLIDGERVIGDSFAIAVHLEAAYPLRPSLFGGPIGLATARFVNSWANNTVMPGLARLVVSDVYPHLHEGDRDYFRTSRERMFGTRLEEITAERESGVVAFRKSIQPMRATLREQPFLAGEQPAYVDYIVFGCFQWARCVSEFAVLEPDDPVAGWRERLLDAFDGLARTTPLSSLSRRAA